MKVSFDYDSTLSTKAVQNYAKKLIDKGIDVIIVTSRYEDKLKHLYPHSASNADLYSTAKKLGINKENIHFTNHNWKADKLKGYKAALHFDDNATEISLLHGTGIKGVNVTNPGWEKKADKILNI